MAGPSNASFLALLVSTVFLSLFDIVVKVYGVGVIDMSEAGVVNVGGVGVLDIGGAGIVDIIGAWVELDESHGNKNALGPEVGVTNVYARKRRIG